MKTNPDGSFTVNQTTLHADGSVTMHGFRISLELIAKDMADLYLQCNKNNRSVRHHKVRRIAQDMEQGDWKLTHQSLAFDTEENILDGQHRLSGISMSDSEQPFFVFRECNRDTFHVVDTGSPRNNRDVLTISSGGMKYASDISTAARYVMFGYRGGFSGCYQTHGCQPADMCALVKEEQQLFCDYARILRNRSFKEAYTSGVLGAFVLAGIIKGRSEIDPMVERLVKMTWTHDDHMRTLYQWLLGHKNRKISKDLKFKTKGAQAFMGTIVGIRGALSNHSAGAHLKLSNRASDLRGSTTYRLTKGWVKRKIED